MRRVILSTAALAGFLILMLVFYQRVLLNDGQFAFRDAANSYYPFHLRVQQEWNAGRWPLWEPGLNGGEPMLGNPMAAVLYPGKMLFALLPYAWSARLYVILHTIIAFLGMVALGRSFGVSWAGSLIAGLSYAFGAPVLFQYGNVIFLVGAAWTPWGLRAIDRLLRLGRRIGLVELAAVLALQVLGGDPEAAYLTALCGFACALVAATLARSRPTRLLTRSVIAGIACFWIATTLARAWLGPVSAKWPSTMSVAWAGWLAVSILIGWRWYLRRSQDRLAPALAKIVGACVLGGALAGAQLLPVLEFSLNSQRAAGLAETNLYRFSLDPFRVVELVWPNPFGLYSPENRSWIQAIPPAGDHELWVDSLYMGGMTLALAVSALEWKSRRSWCIWLAVLAVVGLAASLGKFGSPLWWARWGPFDAILGPHNPLHGRARVDRFLDDGTGSPYGIASMLLPGFGAFRYPSKVLIVVTAALAGLAGAGWDRATAGHTKRLFWLSVVGLVASLVTLGVAMAARSGAVAYLTGRVPPDSTFGPADIAGAWAETQRALAHGAIAFAASAGLARGRRCAPFRRVRWLLYCWQPTSRSPTRD